MLEEPIRKWGRADARVSVFPLRSAAHRQARKSGGKRHAFLRLTISSVPRGLFEFDEPEVFLSYVELDVAACEEVGFSETAACVGYFFAVEVGSAFFDFFLRVAF